MHRHTCTHAHARHTQVVFSSSIMYNNYVTIAQRRRRAEIEKEHTERIQVRVAGCSAGNVVLQYVLCGTCSTSPGSVCG